LPAGRHDPERRVAAQVEVAGVRRRDEAALAGVRRQPVPHRHVPDQRPQPEMVIGGMHA
jgi:hypothetical protein